MRHFKVRGRVGGRRMGESEERMGPMKPRPVRAAANTYADLYDQRGVAYSCSEIMPYGVVGVSAS